MRLERHDGYWLLVGPAAPGAAATTLGSLILMRARAVGDQRLLRHELVHVRQWRDLGVLGFLRRYVGAYLRWRLRRYPHWAAYRRIPLEIDAEWTARRRFAVAGPPDDAGDASVGTWTTDRLRGAERAALTDPPANR